MASKLTGAWMVAGLCLAGITLPVRAAEYTLKPSQQQGAWTQVAREGFGDPGLILLGPLTEFRDQMYVVTMHRSAGCQVWRTTDGVVWEPVVGAPSPYRAGMGKPSDDMIYDLEPFAERLYAGVLNYLREGGALWRSDRDGQVWDVVVGGDARPQTAGFGRAANFGITRLAIYGPYLYASTSNENGTELWRSADGLVWDMVVGPGASVPSGFGSSGNRAMNGLFVYRGALYASTDNPSSGGEVWRADALSY